MRGCAEGVPLALAQEQLCLNHYVDQALARLRVARETCHKGGPIEARTLEWLLADADFVVQSLSQNGFAQSPAQRARVLELLLGLANLQEYLRHHSVVICPID